MCSLVPWNVYLHVPHLDVVPVALWGTAKATLRTPPLLRSAQVPGGANNGLNRRRKTAHAVAWRARDAQ